MLQKIVVWMLEPGQLERWSVGVQFDKLGVGQHLFFATPVCNVQLKERLRHAPNLRGYTVYIHT